MNCRNCKNPRLKTFLDLGSQPPANALKADRRQRIPKYPLALAYCRRCAFVQLTHVVPAWELYRDYPYLTGTSDVHRQHFHDMAEDVLKAVNRRFGQAHAGDFDLPPGGLVVDIGSNDGTLLEGFRDRGMRVIGVEPAKDIAQRAIRNDIPTYNAMFNSSVAHHILRTEGQADLLTATNVLTHVDDVDAFLENVGTLLKPDGTFVVEIYSLLSILNKTLFDLVYHEHLSYFTVRTLRDFLRARGMRLVHVEDVPVHGGSIRAYIRKGVTDAPPRSVAEAIAREPGPRKLIQECERFARRVAEARQDLVRFVRGGRTGRPGRPLRDKPRMRIAGYTAPAKATVLLNYCGLTVKDIEYVVEDNPLKQGKHIPGTRIPIVPPHVLAEEPPDVVLIFAWNIAEEIKKKAMKWTVQDTKFFVPLPELREV